MAHTEGFDYHSEFFSSFYHDNVICQTKSPQKRTFCLLFTDCCHKLISDFFFTCMFNSLVLNTDCNSCFLLCKCMSSFRRQSVYIATQGRPSKKRRIRIEIWHCFRLCFFSGLGVGVTDVFVLKRHRGAAGGGCERRRTGSCVVYFTWHNVCIQSSRETSHRGLSAFWIARRQEMKSFSFSHDLEKLSIGRYFLSVFDVDVRKQTALGNVTKNRRRLDILRETQGIY